MSPSAWSAGCSLALSVPPVTPASPGGGHEAISDECQKQVLQGAPTSQSVLQNWLVLHGLMVNGWSIKLFVPTY